MKELLIYLSSLIVDEADKLVVQEIETDYSKKLLIKVSKRDVKNIIGREGKTIKTIRNIICMAALAKGMKKRIPIEIIDE
ncbi:MAG: KH domain-containing protein [Candidatus Goldbacteria bacterium]|nr:KH domain-containing protein [Candidatus Goldiibacteriota bacterium]HPD18886.1 KH domain-containing protein [Candidatus Goldiibacteriota bacterium]